MCVLLRVCFSTLKNPVFIFEKYAWFGAWVEHQTLIPSDPKQCFTNTLFQPNISKSCKQTGVRVNLCQSSSPGPPKKCYFGKFGDLLLHKNQPKSTLFLCLLPYIFSDSLKRHVSSRAKGPARKTGPFGSPDIFEDLQQA